MISKHILKYGFDEYRAYYHNLKDRLVLVKTQDLSEDEIVSKLIETYPVFGNTCDQDFKLLNNLKLLDRPYKIKTVYFVPTLKCNLSCKYCYIPINRNVESNWNIEKVKNALNLYKAFTNDSEPFIDIVFYGGEPLMSLNNIKVIVETVVKELQKGTYKFTLITNGTLINKKVAGFLKKHAFSILVSIDGEKSVHDIKRKSHYGRGSYDDAKYGVSLLEKYDLNYGISLVAADHNINTLSKQLHFLNNTFNPLSLGVSTLHYNPSYNKDELISPLDIVKNITLEFDSFSSKGIYIEHIMRKVRPFVSGKIRIKDCSATGGKLLFRPNETVGFCEGFMDDDLFFYNFKEFNRDNEGYKTWFNLSPLNNDKCNKCEALYICGGGCPHDAYRLNGALNELDSFRCKQNKFIFQWMVERTILKNQKIVLNMKKGDIIELDYSKRIRIVDKINIDGNDLLSNHTRFGDSF